MHTEGGGEGGVASRQDRVGRPIQSIYKSDSGMSGMSDIR